MKIEYLTEVGSGTVSIRCDGNWPFVFLPDYSRLLPPGSSLIYLRDDSLGAVAPLRLWRNRILRLGQWLYPPLVGGRAMQARDEAIFVDRALKVLKHGRMCDRLVQPPNFAIFQSIPAGAIGCAFGSYRIELDARSEDDVFRSFHQHHRRGIRQAAAKGARVRTGSQEIQIFHKLHQETMARAGLLCPPCEEFERMYREFGTQVRCCVAYDDSGQAQGGVLGTVTRAGFYFLFGASVVRPNPAGAIKLAHWEMIRQCIREEVRVYDFVGARLRSDLNEKLSNIQEFKARFGSKLVEGYLWKADLNRIRTTTYNVANELRAVSRMIRRGKTGRQIDIIDQEIAHGRKSAQVVGG